MTMILNWSGTQPINFKVAFQAVLNTGALPTQNWSFNLNLQLPTKNQNITAPIFKTPPAALYRAVVG
jgi:hypothetical protein